MMMIKLTHSLFPNVSNGCYLVYDTVGHSAGRADPVLAVFRMHDVRCPVADAARHGRLRRCHPACADQFNVLP